MFSKLFFSALLFAAVFTPSFTTIQALEQTQAVGGGNSLTITHPAPGTAVMNWSFSQPADSYFIVIDDIVAARTVKTASTTQTNFTVTGLPSGSYRFKVSNGTDFIIGNEYQ